MAKAKAFSMTWQSMSYLSTATLRYQYKTQLAGDTWRSRWLLFKHRHQFLLGPTPALQQIEFRHFRLKFLENHGLHDNFDFALYLSIVISEYVTGHLDYREVVWLMYLFVLALNIAVHLALDHLHFDKDTEEIVIMSLFLVFGWFLFSVGAVIDWHAHRVRGKLLMKDGIKSAEELFDLVAGISRGDLGPDDDLDDFSLKAVPQKSPRKQGLSRSSSSHPLNGGNNQVVPLSSDDSGLKDLDQDKTHLKQEKQGLPSPGRPSTEKHGRPSAEKHDNLSLPQEHSQQNHERHASGESVDSDTKSQRDSSAINKDLARLKVDDAIHTDSYHLSSPNSKLGGSSTAVPNLRASFFNHGNMLMLGRLVKKSSKKVPDEDKEDKEFQIKHERFRHKREKETQPLCHAIRKVSNLFDLLMLCQCFYMGYFVLRTVSMAFRIWKPVFAVLYLGCCLFPQYLVVARVIPSAIKHNIFVKVQRNLDRKHAQWVEDKHIKNLSLASRLAKRVRKELCRTLRTADLHAVESQEKATYLLSKVFKEHLDLTGSYFAEPLSEKAARQKLFGICGQNYEPYERVHLGYEFQLHGFQKSMLGFRLYVTEKEAGVIIRLLDSDRDGSVSVEEFTAWVFGKIEVLLETEQDRLYQDATKYQIKHKQARAERITLYASAARRATAHAGQITEKEKEKEKKRSIKIFDDSNNTGVVDSPSIEEPQPLRSPSSKTLQQGQTSPRAISAFRSSSNKRSSSSKAVHQGQVSPRAIQVNEPNEEGGRGEEGGNESDSDDDAEERRLLILKRTRLFQEEETGNTSLVQFAHISTGSETKLTQLPPMNLDDSPQKEVPTTVRKSPREEPAEFEREVQVQRADADDAPTLSMINGIAANDDNEREEGQGSTMQEPVGDEVVTDMPDIVLETDT
eukprot:g13469.t1